MQEDSFPAAEKILSDIENIFRKDAKLKSIEVLPVIMNENKSPIHHEEHCLGLEFWCVRHVYTHAYNHVMDIRKNRKKNEDYTRLNRLLIGALVINPDITSFWNMRKELLLQKKIDANFELHFSAAVLSRNPKCADIFSHRKWVIQNILKDHPVDSGIINNEMRVCEISSDRYSNNSHAWTHRIWCFSQMNQNPRGNIAFLEQEWHWCKNWISTHISDYSGFQYRQYLISKLIDLCFSNNIVGFLESINDSVECFFNSVYLKEFVTLKGLSVSLQIVISELVLNSNLINTYPGHEALWCHRRFILFKIKELVLKYDCNETTTRIWYHTTVSNHLNSDGEPLEKDKKIEDSSVNKLAMLVCIYEERFVMKYLSGSIRSLDVGYCKKHKQWLEKILKMQFLYNLDLLK